MVGSLFARLMPWCLPMVGIPLAVGLADQAHSDELDDLVGGFTNAPGWQIQNVDTVDERLLEMFSYGGQSAMRPDGEASPLEKALLLVDVMEMPLPRVRYMLRYGQQVADGTPYSFITVERYNLGPTVHSRTMIDVGAENTADASEFGVGPHVAWRVVTMPIMGNTAMLVEVSRREIPEAEAEQADCVVGRCLDLSALIDNHRNWQEQTREFTFASPYLDRGPEGFAVPARAAAELSAATALASVEGGTAYWTGPEQPEAARDTEPFLLFYADNNAGQDWTFDAMIGQTLLNDDSIGAMWERRLELEGSLYWFTAADRR